MIPYSTQDINEADVKAVVQTLKSGWLTQGPAIERFEKALAKKVGAKFAVTFNSGTAALHAAYFSAGITKGDEIIVPALTFAATANAALYLGAKPVFADIDPATGNMSVADVRKNITKKTKVIVPVDYTGRPADMREFRALAKKYKLVLIEDGAQSLGASYRGKKTGSLADMTIFSFHPVKSITTAEGGAVTTNDAEYARTLRLFRSHGITKEKLYLRRNEDGGWHMEMHALGFNYRMPDILAALGESQLKRLDSFIAKRRAAAKRYGSLLKNIPGVVLPLDERAFERSAWHLYTLRLKDPSKRRAVFDSLRSQGIGVQVHHIPVHTHPLYEDLGYSQKLCPKTQAFVAAEISLPLFAKITPAQQKRVAEALRTALKNA